jgi:hypothetical protein
MMILALVTTLGTLWAVLVRDLPLAIVLLLVTGSLWATILKESEWVPREQIQTGPPRVKRFLNWLMMNQVTKWVLVVPVRLLVLGLAYLWVRVLG